MRCATATCSSFQRPATCTDTRENSVKSSPRKIKASELVQDIESGLNDFHMMQKHGVDAKQLEYLFNKLTEAGLVTKRQLRERTALAETAITKAFVDVQSSIEELDDDSDTGSIAAYKDALRDLADEAAPPLAPSISRDGRPPLRKIKASDLVKDITSGKTDPELMQKYQLDANQLEYMLGKLVEAGSITETQLMERTKITSTSITKAFVDVYQSLRELEEADWDS